MGEIAVDLKKLEQVLFFEVGELGNLDYKHGVPGPLKLMREKKLTMINPPGFDFINDKKFCQDWKRWNGSFRSSCLRKS